MSGERSEVEELFDRQEAERAGFVRSQIRRLEDAGYDWKLPARFRESTGYKGKGLLIEKGYSWQDQYRHMVLSPVEGLIYVQKDFSNQPVSLIGGGMTGSGISDLKSLERTVTQVLARFQPARAS